jgi:aryl carrier-like protein
VQALAEAPADWSPRLWLVTRGAQHVADADGPLAVAQVPLWGFGRTLAHEHPELRCTRIDLAPSATTDEARALAEALRADERETELALRPDGLHVSRLQRCSPAPAPIISPASTPTFRPDGTYLITGGLGGLGLALAQWLVEHGARHLVLVGRRGATPAAEPALAALREAGAEVTVASADVSAEHEVAAVLAQVDAALPPLRGVFHAAGILDDGTILRLDRERFAAVMAPKLRGAWNLHTLTSASNRPLDHFVLFSSFTSVLGSPGQASYAAANAFLDALAADRHARGLPALSVNWAPWAEIGLAAARSDRGARLAGRGVESLRPDRALAALGRLLGQDAPQVGVMELDPVAWRRHSASAESSAFLDALLPTSATRAPHEAPPPTTNGRAHPSITRQILLDHGSADRLTVAEAYLRERAAAVLQLPTSELDVATPLIQLGLDSLMGVELRNRIEADLGIAVPLVSLFRDASVARLTTNVLEQLAPAVASVGAGWEEGSI